MTTKSVGGGRTPGKQKCTVFGLTLQPTTARYMTTIWVSIDFYFFRRKQKK